MKNDSTVYRMPRGMMVDINKVPDDFDEGIRGAFREYTTGTSRDYTYHDKLLFIDNCVRAFHGNRDEEEAVCDLIHEAVDYKLSVGELPDAGDYNCLEFMQDCYLQGANSQKLYSEYMQIGSREDDKIMQLLIRIIKVVIDFEWEVYE